MWEFYPIVMRDSTLVKLALLLSLKQLAISSSARGVHSSAFARLTVETRTRPPTSCHRFIQSSRRLGRAIITAPAQLWNAINIVWSARAASRVGNLFHTAEKCPNLMSSRSVLNVLALRG